MSRIIKVGGGGSERFMIAVPLAIGLFFSIYALGGPTEALTVLEHWAQSALTYIRELFR
jgi:DMSO reductase anchor subunit